MKEAFLIIATMLSLPVVVLTPILIKQRKRRPWTEHRFSPPKPERALRPAR